MSLQRCCVYKKDILDYIIIYLILLQIFFLNWLNINLTFLITIIVLMSIITRLRYCLKYMKILQVIFIMCTYIFIHYICVGGDVSLLAQNVGKIIMRIVICYYFATLISMKPEFIAYVMKRLLLIFNIYALLNVPIIILQLLGHYSLAARGMNLTSFMWQDMVSGLFGLYGTPYMATFFSFLIIYNYELLSKEYNIVKYRRTLKIFNICLLVFNCIVSLYNDNKGFYIILFSFIMAYYLVKIITKAGRQSFSLKFFNIIKKSFPIIIMLSIIYVIMYKYTSFKNTVDSIIRIINNATSNVIIAGSSERLAMIFYAFKRSDIRWLGAGLGKYGLKQSGALGFLHFGQSDFGTFMCLGGIFLVVSIFVTMHIIMRRIFNDSYIILVEMILLLLLTIFTNVFTATSITASYMLYVITCWLCMRRMSLNKRR